LENNHLPETIQTQITHRTGIEIEVEISTQVVFDEENKLDHIILLVNDISARKTAERKSQMMLSRLFSIHQLHLNISTYEELELISDLVLNVLKRELDFSAAVLMIKEAEFSNTNEMTLFAEIGFDPKYIKNHQMKKSRFDAFEKEFLRNSNWIEGHAVDFLDNEAMREVLSQAGFVHYIGVPLITNHKIIGLINFFNHQPFTIDYETKSFVLAIAKHLASAVENYQTINELKQNNQDLTTSIQAIMMAWANTLELHEKGNIKHAERVAEMIVQFAKQINVPHDELIHLQRGALLHDIGKIGLPDKILSKPEKTRTDEEKRMMRQHPIYALKILSSIEYLKNAASIPVYHHENWDGSGYPYGLSKTDIPFSARLFAIIDVWDRLTSDLPYCPSWKKEDALMHIQNQSGKQFDPELVLAFEQFILKETEILF
jgi:response regulator RpfG family c-di-GMP phosphodiesterase